MEILAFVIALLIFAVLSVELGSDSRPVDDTRAWWPGYRSDEVYPQHHA